MPAPGKNPYEIPSSPDKPEITTPEEVPTKTWPEKNPEINPEQDPEPGKTPYEIPSPEED